MPTSGLFQPNPQAALDTAATGKKIFRGLGTLFGGLGSVASTGAELAGDALAPVRGGGRALTALSNAAHKFPRLTEAAVLTGLTAPIILSDARPTSRNESAAILHARYNPEQTVTLEPAMHKLSAFLEKKAAGAANPMPLGQSLGRGLLGDLAGGVGQELAKMVMHGAGRAFGAARDAFSTNPARKQLLEKLLASDPVLSDAVRRNPATLEQLMEAYQTMLRYAPSLTVDANAVRSFLREVVLGGGHVNYATIKNLIETEKSLHGDMPKYKGSFV